MHDASKLGSFLALRANGWSLSHISRDLNISKSTLWDWDNKHQNDIHLLKHLQLEKLQEKYLPTYEEELTQLRSYLDRLEAALAESQFGRMEPGNILQMILQVRSRMAKMREQVPLRNLPLNEPLAPLPFTGCVTRQDAQEFKEEYSQGQSPEAPEAPPAAEPSPISNNPEPSAEPSACSANRTFPDEIPPGVENRPLIHNDLRRRKTNSRPVLPPRNAHGNGNGNCHHKPEPRSGQ